MVSKQASPEKQTRKEESRRSNINCDSSCPVDFFFVVCGFIQCAVQCLHLPHAEVASDGLVVDSLLSVESVRLGDVLGLRLGAQGEPLLLVEELGAL